MVCLHPFLSSSFSSSCYFLETKPYVLFVFEECTWWTSWLWTCSVSGPGSCLERLWLVWGREHDVTEELLFAWHPAEVNWLQRDWNLESFCAVRCFWSAALCLATTLKNEPSFALLCILSYILCLPTRVQCQWILCSVCLLNHFS